MEHISELFETCLGRETFGEMQTKVAYPEGIRTSKAVKGDVLKQLSLTTNGPLEETSIEKAVAILNTLHQISAEQLRGDPRAREMALDLSQKLMNCLSDPVNIGLEMAAAPLKATVIRIAIDLKLFETLAQTKTPISTRELSRLVNAEELLTKRILRLLGSIGFITEFDCDLWGSNSITEAMSLGFLTAGFRYRWDITTVSAVHAPRYFREFGHISPTVPNNGVFQFAHRTQHDVFNYLNKVEPERLLDFNIFMGNTMGLQSDCFDWYPVKTRLLDGSDANMPLLVDVGGGKGHDVQSFRKQFPEAQGGVFLQDLPQAFASIPDGSLDPHIELQVHDFFTPNPVSNARIYLLHHILHDWSDGYCLQILAHIRAAMDPGYSRLLIHELILPNKSVSTQQALFDIQMMVFNGGMERTQDQWTDLLKRAGFEPVGFWQAENGSSADGVIEVIVDA